MNKAVFLDRDGVVNRKGSGYYVFREEEFLFNRGVTSALKYFISKGYILVIVTNQGGIARGIYTITHLEKLHNYMIQQLKAFDIELAGIYYCPHHPSISSCQCRKPGTLMFEQAIAKYDIDPKSSFMIGDSEIDIRAAEKMGIKGILIPTNGNMMELVVNAGKI
ncbi:MAG: HAD family hydrolase [Odoribacter sp.]|nr:HAD family hydrolase [Odoribacter sp.]